MPHKSHKRCASGWMPLVRHRWIVLLIIVFHPFPPSIFGLEADGRRVFELPETAWVRYGDEESWADPELSTNGWVRIQLKGRIPNRILPGAFTEPFIWYRMELPSIRFPVGGTLNVYIEGISGASVAYINGQKASQSALDFSGRTGRFPVIPPTGFPHTFRIRNDQWNHSGANLLALRIQRRPGPAGLIEGRALIGYAIVTRPFQNAVHRQFEILETVSLSGLTLAFFTCFYLIIVKRNDIVSWTMLPVFFMLLLNLWIQSHGIYRTGLGGFWVLPVGVFIELLFLWLALNAVRRLLDQSAYPWPVFVLTACGMCAASALVHAFAHQYLLSWILLGIQMCLLALSIRTNWMARRKYLRELAPVMIGLIVIAISFALSRWMELVLGGTHTYWIRPMIASNILVGLFFMSLALRLRGAIDDYRMLVKENLLSQESERRHIAMDLHDGIGQTLQSLKLHIQMNHGMPGALDPLEWKNRALSALDSCIEELRSVAMRLRPVYLGRKPLSEALAYHAEQFSADTGIQVTFDSTLEVSLPEEVEDHLFRIQQEALTNASKHAQPSFIHIHLTTHKSHLILKIENDGVAPGLEASRRALSGNGIRNMRERASLLNGSFTIRNQDLSTLIEVVAPLRWDKDS